MDERYDVVVIGAGAAGLSGAVALARSCRSVLVVDDGTPRNQPAAHVHNYLTRDGVPPPELLAAGREEAQRYGAHIVAARVQDVSRTTEGFQVRLDDERVTHARRLLVATGLTDELPDMPGLAERWGRDVLHCPYCHGWEVRGRRIGVLAESPLAVMKAQLWRQLSEHVLLVLHRTAPPPPEELERLAARGIAVVHGEVTGLVIEDDQLVGLRLESGTVVEVEALAVSPRFTAHADLVRSLGIEPVDVEVGDHVIGSRIPADPIGATAVPGVWVAGNATDLMAQVITSAAAGLTAGAAINADLITEDTGAAVETYRRQQHTLFDQAAWEERYSAKPAIWSGNPNPHLVAHATDLPAGRALDVGSGEGADAIWLAERGWQVEGVDISTTALERAAVHAESAGAGTASRITWVHADLRDKPPPAASFDLVTAQFMHLPREDRERLYGQLAAAVAPGGVLLIVGHHPSDLHTTAHRMHFPDMMFTPEQVAGMLDPGEWDVQVAEAFPREATDPQGRRMAIQDTVVVARRR